MMLRLIDRGKIYFYFVLIFILLSIHNLNFISSINQYFKIKKIIIESNIEENLNKKISISLNKFNNYNIFSINSDEIKEILDNFNIISEYKIKKEYPSILKIKLKETNILAYYFEKNQKTFLGENGKKIENKTIVRDDLPLIAGNVDIKKFLYLKKKLNNNGFKLSEFKTFYFFKSKRWDLHYKNEIIVKLPIEDLELSISLLKNIIKNSNIKDIKIIDLRVKNRIILS